MPEKKNDFSVGSIPRNILSMALPMTVAQLVDVLYSVVDRIYLGHLPGVNHLALTGIGVTMPIVSVIMGLANLCGTGGSPLCAMVRGRGDNEEAERTMGNAFALLLTIGLAATALLMLVRRPMLYAFGASDETFPYANEYLTIHLLGTLFVMVSLGMNPFINAQGFGRVGMMTVVLGAATNIILDPILILWAHMGVRGAALATIIAQGLSCAWVLRFLTGSRGILRLRRRHIRLEGPRTRRIIGLGLSGFFMNLTNSLVQVVCNTTLLRWGGDLYVGVMTIINSVREVVVMPLHGLNNGSQPVTSFNYGAKQYERVRESIRFTVGTTVLYSAAFWALAMLLPSPFIHTGIEIYILEEALDANPEPLTLFGIDLKRINDRYLTDKRTLISNGSKQLSDAIVALRAAHTVSTDLARLRFHSLTVLHLLSAEDIQLVPMHLSALTAQQVNAAKSAEKALTQDLSKRLSIAEVAREIGVGETSLKNWFRAVFGKNISAYLRDHRIAEAKRLLDGTALPISAIGNTVGFENQSKFTQMFKKHCGLTPSDYRKRNML